MTHRSKAPPTASADAITVAIAAMLGKQVAWEAAVQNRAEAYVNLKRLGRVS